MEAWPRANAYGEWMLGGGVLVEGRVTTGAEPKQAALVVFYQQRAELVDSGGTSSFMHTPEGKKVFFLYHLSFH